MPDPRMLVAALDNALNSLMRQVHRQATISFQEAAIEFQPSRRTTSGQAAITYDNILLATLRRQTTPRHHVTAPRLQNAPIPVIVDYIYLSYLFPSSLFRLFLSIFFLSLYPLPFFF